MFAVLAEDKSDAEALVILVKRISEQPRSRVFSSGFGGCGELCRKAGKYLANFASMGATHFIICQDSDGNPPAEIRSKLYAAVTPKFDVKAHPHAIIVPVQEIEAWILADEAAVGQAIPTLKLREVRQPETIDSPKEELIRRSTVEKSKPLYVPTTHNPVVAKHLNIDTVSRKCPSFRELATFVRGAASPDSN